MPNLFTSFFQKRLQLLDRDQGGAIIFLVLAGILVLLLTILMMFEAGEVAQDKMLAQNAADTAAYSQSAVKARSMNMIAYANTSKRMFYSYWVTYVAAAQALAISTPAYCSSCNIFNWYACYRCIIGGIQGALEVLHLLILHVPDALQRAQSEISTLNNFQHYLVGITPWWGYAENLFRGTQNGATITTSWPPPKATLPGWAASLVSAVVLFDSIFDTSFSGRFPDISGRFDELPVSQRREGWLNTPIEHADYCAEFLLSMEHITPAIEHVMRSDGGGWDPMGISTDGQTLGIFLLQILNPANCFFAFTLLGTEGFPFGLPDFPRLGSDVHDFRVDGGFMGAAPSEQEWLQNTSNITFAYQNTRRSQKRDDRRYANILVDHTDSPLYQSDGTWSMARSEIMWSETGTAAGTFNQLFGGMGNIGALINGVSNFTAGPLVAIRGGPNMWQPRWTNRLRPLHLPDESLGSTIRGNPIGLGTVFLDSIPYMAVSTLISSIVEGNFNITQAVNDLYYMYVVSSSYTSEDLQGLAK